MSGGDVVLTMLSTPFALAGLRRSNVGGFGAQIPEEYEGGGASGFA
jgi:hypothetical protein